MPGRIGLAFFIIQVAGFSHIPVNSITPSYDVIINDIDKSTDDSEDAISQY